MFPKSNVFGNYITEEERNCQVI